MKNLLTEAELRRMMKLANVRPINEDFYSSRALEEADPFGEEDEETMPGAEDVTGMGDPGDGAPPSLETEPALDPEGGEDEMGMEAEPTIDLAPDEAADLVDAILAGLATKIPALEGATVEGSAGEMEGGEMDVMPDEASDVGSPPADDMVGDDPAAGLPGDVGEEGEEEEEFLEGREWTKNDRRPGGGGHGSSNKNVDKMEEAETDEEAETIEEADKVEEEKVEEGINMANLVNEVTSRVLKRILDARKKKNKK